MKRHWFSFLLALLLILTSCGNAATPEETAQTPEDAPVEVPEEETEETDARNIKDDVPQLDFGSGSFRSIGQSSGNKDIYAAEETGEALNDAIYIRNRSVEERLNIVIEPMEEIWYTDLSSKIHQCVLGGDDAYELILGQMEQSGADSQEGIFRNWYDVPYTDFSKPWYPKSVTDRSASINGKMYIVVSDMLITFASNTWAVVFDKVRAADFGLGNLYDTVYAGEWTLDYLLGLSDSVYTDTNGDGNRDRDDLYAFTSASGDGCLMASFLYGSEVRFAEIRDDHVVMTLNNDKSVSVFEKLHRLFYESQGVWDTNSAYSVTDGVVTNLLLTQFTEGKTVFANSTVGSIGSGLRDYENDYGVLPIPKYDASQTEYYTVTDAGCNIMAVSVIAAQLDMIGAVTECLAAESFRSVMPTYYDITLAAKGVRDVESSEMMDYVLRSRQLDFAYMYDGWNGWVFHSSEFISQAGQFASVYKKYEKLTQKYYDKVLAFFNEPEP